MTEPEESGRYCYGKDDYESKFDPEVFLREYANTEAGVDSREAVLQMVLKWIETFASGAVQGQRLLEFGCGPCLHTVIPASRRFEEIYMCEYASPNRQVIQDWIDKKPNAYDWTPFFKFVAEKEGEGSTYQEIEERMRKNIRDVISCDIHKENPFEPIVFEPGFFDCITENFCLGSACKTEEEFKAAIRKLGVYIRPGGRMFMVGALRETHYKVGDEKFSYLYTTPQLLEAAFKEAGFRDVRVGNKEVELLEGVSDAEEIYFLEGTKQ